MASTAIVRRADYPPVGAVPGGSAIASAAGSELTKALKDSIPGLPFDPGLLTGVLSGKLDVESIAKEAAVQLVNLAVPGLGVPLRLALPAIEKMGGAIADVLTGAKAKRDRRRRNWRGIRGIFNMLMDRSPLMIYATGKQVPSKLFVSKFTHALNNPAAWVDSGYYPKGKAEIPYWVQSSNALKRDYEGSGLPGKRTGVAYWQKAIQPAEIVKMLDSYYKLPGKKERYEKAVKNLAAVTKKKADEIRASRPRASRPIVTPAPVQKARPAELQRSAMPKKKKISKKAAAVTALALKKKMKEKKQKGSKPKIAFQRSGPYQYTVMRVQVSPDRWVDIHSRVDTRKIASALMQAPQVSGDFSRACGGVGRAVRTVARVASVDRALRDARHVLTRPGTINPAGLHSLRCVDLARRLNCACIAARRGDPRALAYVRQAVDIARATPRRKAPPSAAAVRSAVATVKKLYPRQR
jgi:hypothetical protein